MSIKPKFVNQIFNKVKKYEYRTKEVRFNRGDKIFIYCTSPIKKIVGFFTFGGFEIGTPEEIWEKTHENSGIEKEEFFSYFQNQRKAIAIRIVYPKKLNNPLNLIDIKEYVKGFHPPQSFCYLRREGKFSNLLSYLESLLTLEDS